MRGRLPKCKCPVFNAEFLCAYYKNGFCWKSRQDEVNKQFEKNWNAEISKIFNR